MSRKTPKQPSTPSVKVVSGEGTTPRMSDRETAAGQQTIPFPGTAARQRLVAGRVGGNPLSDVSTLVEDSGPIKFPKPERGMSSPELIRQIEQTLDRMQRKLDAFKEHVDESFKFPGAGNRDDDGNDWPPRAA